MDSLTKDTNKGLTQELKQAVIAIKTAILQSQGRAARMISGSQLSLYFGVGFWHPFLFHSPAASKLAIEELRIENSTFIHRSEARITQHSSFHIPLSTFNIPHSTFTLPI